MKHKGQTLVAFVIIVPVFIIFLAFVVDTSYLFKEYTHLNNTTKTILKNTYQKRLESDYYDIVKNLFQKNNISVENLEAIVDENKVEIFNRYNIKSIFGQVIGIKQYEIKVEMFGIEKNEKLIVEKE